MNYLEQLTARLERRIERKVFTGYCAGLQQNPFNTEIVGDKPYSQWAAQEKQEVALGLLGNMSLKPKECSTSYPGPLPLEQMRMMHEIYKNKRIDV